MRIDTDNLLRMPWHLNLRDDRNVLSRRISHHFPNLFPGIISPVGTCRITGHVLSVPFPPGHITGFRPPGRPSRQFRILSDLHPPSRSVRQMPMETVQLIDRHPIQAFHHKLFRKKMPGNIQVQSPVRKSRIIRNTQSR